MNCQMPSMHSLLLLVLLSSGMQQVWAGELSASSASGQMGTMAARVSGERRKWHKVTLTFDGPNTSETADPNPFTDYRLNVTFTHEDGDSFVVPGFYGADGDAGNSGANAGNKWMVRFTPNRTGTWGYRASFRKGENVAVRMEPNAGTAAGHMDEETGSFVIQDSDKTGRDFRAKGMAMYVGRHYVQFAETGEYFIKGGADSPENFLGYYEFDDVSDQGGRTALGNDGLHHYEPHAADYSASDAQQYLWRSDKGKNILGAIKYLSDRGVNSVYFLTYNIDGGDGRETHPWLGEGGNKKRYDCSRLDQWENVFAYMDKKGLMLHVVTQEEENDQELGDHTDLRRQLYFRELVSRFSHHLNVQWNLGEENSNTDEEVTGFAEYIRALDPYDHPIAVHIRDNNLNRWEPHYGKPYMEAASIQSNPASTNHAQAVKIWERSEETGRPWCAYEDEQNKEGVKPDLSNLEEMREETLWGNLLGCGAGVEWYFSYHSQSWGDLTLEDFRLAEVLWDQTVHALHFFQRHVPSIETMRPGDGLTDSDDAWCMYAEDRAYVVYLKNGGTTEIDLRNASGTYRVRWYDPVHGGDLQTGSTASIEAGGKVSIGMPPASQASDWAVLIEREDQVESRRRPNSRGVQRGSIGVHTTNEALVFAPGECSPPFRVRVFSSAGKLLWTSAHGGEHSHRYGSLLPGVYIVSIEEAGAKRSVCTVSVP